MRAKERFASGVLAAVMSGAGLVVAQTSDRGQLERFEETLRQEGQAVVALADAAARNQHVPSDFPLNWHNDFLKAQNGTFVPFIVTIGPAELNVPAVLVYIRAARRPADDRGRGGKPRSRAADEDVAPFPFEDIYPIELTTSRQPVRVVRGFSVAPGEYDITVVVRERERGNDRRRNRSAAVLHRPLSVPDFTREELTASTVILADRLTVPSELPPPSAFGEHPYVIAGQDIRPSPDRIFSRSDELIVIFLIYYPSVTAEKHFDLEVEYHFFRRSGAEEAYFNRTEPQRFNPVTLGPHYDPSGGHPIMAGQGVPLGGFPDGEYKLAIKVTDLISGRSLSREVTFTVRS